MWLEIEKVISNAIASQVFPGCALGIVERGGETEVRSFGNFRYVDSPPVSIDSVFDIASVTKSIPIATLTMMLIESKETSLDKKVSYYLPEFSNGYCGEVTVWHLLSYTIEGLRLSKLKDLDPNEITKIILRSDLVQPPGAAYKYTNVPAFLLRMIIEKISNQRLDEIADKLVFSPLGMTRTTFHPLKNVDIANDEIVPTEIDDWRGAEICGVVHDESAYTFYRAGLIAGHSGLFSTVPDLSKFMQMLLNYGNTDGIQMLSEETVTKMLSNQTPHLASKTGLGWEMDEPYYMGKSSGTMFGKRGFTGCVVLGDLSKGRALVLLSNRTYPKRPESPDAINEVRYKISNIVFADNSGD